MTLVWGAVPLLDVPVLEEVYANDVVLLGSPLLLIAPVVPPVAEEGDRKDDRKAEPLRRRDDCVVGGAVGEVGLED